MSETPTMTPGWDDTRSRLCQSEPEFYELEPGGALGLPLAVRSAIVFAVLAPLGFVMGLPFPLAMRILRPEATALVPWAWATNGWMSVVASLGTVILSRLFGYDVAFGAALLAYVLAFGFARSLPKIGRTLQAS